MPASGRLSRLTSNQAAPCARDTGEQERARNRYEAIASAGIGTLISTL